MVKSLLKLTIVKILLRQHWVLLTNIIQLLLQLNVAFQTHPLIYMDTEKNVYVVGILLSIMRINRKRIKYHCKKIP